jgi:CheY-like chemotaxis protein/signal transduction histidine kinase/CHASE3 domain sensor protein
MDLTVAGASLRMRWWEAQEHNIAHGKPAQDAAAARRSTAESRDPAEDITVTRAVRAPGQVSENRHVAVAAALGDGGRRVYAPQAPKAGAIVANEPAEQKVLSRRLLVALLTPIVLLVATGSVLGVQLLRMSDDAHWVDASDEVLAKTYDLQTQILDQQTGLRGYLLTNDRHFLEPYLEARPLESLAAVRALVSSNPASLARVDEVRRRYDEWSKEAAVAARGPSSEIRPYDWFIQSRRRMDDLRAAITTVLDAERSMRAQRAETAAESTRLSRDLFIGLFVASGLALAFLSRGQLAGVAQTYARALEGERSARASVEDEAWIRAGQAKVGEQIQGQWTLQELGERLLHTLAPLVSAEVGAVFTAEPGGWKRRAAYGVDTRCAGPESFPSGEGLVGRVAEDKALLCLPEVPADFLKVRSGVGEAPPAAVVLAPAVADGTTLGVVELGFFRHPSARARELLGRVRETIAMAIRSAEYKARLRELLEDAQRQAEELQTQQEELQAANEEVGEQRNVLSKAHAQLEERNDELQTINVRLEEQSNELRAAQQRAAEKAEEAERASRYKSEFLANMSHELRTPLNSTLILAQLLAENKGGNLTEEQVSFALTIRSAGNELLALVNDVLDLAKIEAGKIELRVLALSIERLVASLSRTFEPVARERGLDLSIVVDPSAPRSIDTDAQRLEQILKNLLSNALKFTEAGGVSLRVAADGPLVTFAVHDTGIGIPEAQHERVFEAFRQGDGASTRKHGGTGLGLSISRDLARLLGGTLTLESEPGQGSTFTLTIPRAIERSSTTRFEHGAEHVEARRARAPGAVARSDGVAATWPLVADDRASLDRGKPLVLVIEDDLTFAQILRDLAHEHGFQCVVASGAEPGIALAIEHRPSAIVLDVLLPDHSGMTVLERLKRNPATRHIPVHMVSVADHTQAALAMGAVGYLLKPVSRDHLVGAFRKLEERLSRQVRRILVVEDDGVQRESLGKLLGGDGIEVRGVASVDAALAALSATTFDCLVTDLMLPGASGFDLLDRMAEDPASGFPPVIVYTGRSLSTEEEQRLRRHSSSIIVKGARSPERLLDEVTLFLHQVESDLPADRRKMLELVRNREALFEGRRILVAEDDVRNIFALSRVLEPRGAEVVVARNGRDAIGALEQKGPIDLVLMDIMMPEMDGLEATREIRKRPDWAKLPVIALTAKAMKDDHRRCREAGANDYIAKPLDVDVLLSLLRVWMPR